MSSATLRQELYRDLIGPLFPSLEGKRRLILVPDDVLWNVPFDLLADQDTLLAERFSLSYAPSLSAYGLAWERRGISQHEGVLVGDRELLDLPVEVVDVVMTRKEFDGRTLVDLARDDVSRGVFLRRITRAGTTLGVLPDTKVQRGDVLTVTGSAASTARVAEAFGVADRPTDVTDMLVVATGIVAGALIGLPALHIGGVEIGLSLPVGVLLGGLVCGWLRSVRPRWFGRIPGPTLWIFESIGLAGFVAVVGLNAGPDFVQGLRTSGVSLLVAGALTISIALLIGVLAGRWLFKMHPGVLLGVCAGACTATPALAAVQEAARSSVPSIGYGVAYAVGNVFLAIWGTVIVALLA